MAHVQGIAQKDMSVAAAFYKKFTNDWVLNLAGMLAYNLLMTFFPIVLAIVAIAGFALGAFGMQDALINALQQTLPSSVSDQLNLRSIVEGLHRSSGLLGIVSLLGLLWGGSNLFSIMEACFDIIFRAEQRAFIPQKLMSVGMIIVFAILAPLMTAAASLTAGAAGIATHLPVKIPGLTLILSLAGPAVGLLAAFVLFLIIYMVVPNMKIAIKHAWRGAIVAAALLTVINLVFPLYVSHFLNAKQYGATAGFAIVLVTWFWFFSVILLLGAEVNSVFGLGQQPSAGDLPLVMHTTQVHGGTKSEGADAVSPPEGHPPDPAAATKRTADPRAPRPASVQRPFAALFDRNTRNNPQESAPTGRRTTGLATMTLLAVALSALAGVLEAAIARRPGTMETDREARHGSR